MPDAKLLTPEELADILTRATRPTPDSDADAGPTCARCDALVTVDNGCVWIQGEDMCHGCAQLELDRARYDVHKLLDHISALTDNYARAVALIDESAETFLSKILAERDAATAALKLFQDLAAKWEAEAEKALARLEAMTTWVTTDELLPEFNHTVLVWWDERESICAAFLANEGWSHGLGRREALPFSPRWWRPMPPRPASGDIQPVERGERFR